VLRNPSPKIARLAVGFLLAAALLLEGCRRKPVQATPPPPERGTSELEILPAEQVPRATDPERKKVLAPESAPGTVRQDLPGYPETALGDAVECTATVLYHIETDGSARLVRLEWELEPPAEHVAAFEDAIRTAVGSWLFEPAKRYRFKEVADGSFRYDEQVIPKAARAIVRFRVVAGRGVVE